MYRILEAQFIAPGIKRFVIDVPRIAKKHQAGQFVILRLHERGERIPITIESSDREKGTIQIVVQAVGKTTYELNALEKGQAILDVVGPLGKPSEIEKYGTVAVLGGGVGTALAYPTTAALKKAGNRILTILGGRGRELVLAVGPVPMMKAVADLTREHGIRTIVSLNPIMIDGTGMCGGCRVLVGGKSQFACVDGPEFDAHQVDFGVLTQRNRMYRDAEKESLERFQQACEDNGQRGACGSGVEHVAPMTIAGGKP